MDEPPRDQRTSELPTARRPSRPLRLLFVVGLALAALGAAVMVGGFLLESLIGLQAVAAQVVAFPIATAAFGLGLLLAFVGWGLSSPDGQDPAERLSGMPRGSRRAVLALSLGGLAALSLLGLGTARSVAVVDSSEFCTSCHAAMAAEEVAYAASPHARVSCADCHVGPGIGWFVRSKLVGLQELAAYVSGQWEQPIPVPVANLRPAQDTCEQCHWPARFSGDRLVVRPHFAPDEANTATANVLVVHTGGGATGSVGAGGIHYNMLAANTVRYFASDPGRQQIPWVEVMAPDGKTTVYRDLSAAPPTSPSPDQIRRFDCVDCHNRPTHIFPTPDQALDAALDSGAIDRSLPFVKREGLAALGEAYTDRATAHQRIDARLRAFYQQSYPALGESQRASIDGAVAAIQGIYDKSFFPETKVDWQTYPDNLGHQRDSGCFRCHDGKHVSDAGRTISSACDTCHTAPQALPLRDATTLSLQASLIQRSAPSAKAIPHTLEGRSSCLSCHASGAQAVPTDHAGRTNDTCQSCHKPGASAASAPSGPTARAVPHLVQGFSACLSCHARGDHAVPSDHDGRTDDLCQSCHVPSPSATAAPTASDAVEIPHVLTDNADCLSCHSSGPQAIPPDHAGRTNDTCQSCHAQDKTVAAIPHVVAGFTQCLGCHASGPTGVPASHAGRTNDTCQFCHVADPGSTAIPIQAAVKIPHVLAGNSACLSCHASGAQAVPASHAGRVDSTCQACHQPDTSVAKIPHLVTGFTRCLSCHSTGAQAVPMPTHRGRADATCQFCHAPRPGATVVPRQAAANIPHVLAGRTACLTCHASGAQAVPTSHVGRANNTCQVCHKLDPAVANAPRITHTVARFGDCLGCHAAGPRKVPADHAGRTNAVCLDCHVQSAGARALRAGERMPHPSTIGACLNCHRVGGGEEGLPASHAGRTSNVCRICH